MQIVNKTGYAYRGKNTGKLAGTPTLDKRKTLSVTFILDQVEGAFHSPEDLMKWVASNPYVDTVTLVE